jgi:hypothetical protein
MKMNMMLLQKRRKMKVEFLGLLMLMIVDDSDDNTAVSWRDGAAASNWLQEFLRQGQSL